MSARGSMTSMHSEASRIERVEEWKRYLPKHTPLTLKLSGGVSGTLDRQALALVKADLASLKPTSPSRPAADKQTIDWDEQGRDIQPTKEKERILSQKSDAAVERKNSLIT